MAASSISEVIEQLNEIVIRSAAGSDRAGYFAALYKRVTMAVAEKIRQGYFDDNARMEKLDVIFANRYLDAYQNYKEGNPCSSCWCLAFDAAKSWKPMVIHHLLTGMNAHISLDLGIAAATVSPGNDINNIQNDFYKINTVLAELVDDVKAQLFDMWPLSKLLLRFNTAKLENAMAGFSMTIARDAAWQVALEYAPLNIAPNQQLFISARDKVVTAFGQSLLHPKPWVNTVTAVLRIFEFGTVGSKIKRLNTP